MTVNNALFAKLNKKWKYYYQDDESSEMIISDQEKVLLEEERKGKEMRLRTSEPWFEKMLDKYLTMPYIHLLKKTVADKKLRRISVWAPVVALIATFIFLAPSIGFTIFPSGDTPFANYEIEGKE